MIKCTILLPQEDNFGESLLAEHDDILSYIYECFGGYSVDSGAVTGAYRMKCGYKSCDKSLRVSVWVENTRLGEFSSILPFFATKLRQEVLYFERSTATVEFVLAAANGSKSKSARVRHTTDTDLCDFGLDLLTVDADTGEVTGWGKRRRSKPVIPKNDGVGFWTDPGFAGPNAGVNDKTAISIGEFSAKFDGRNSEHNRQASIDEENRIEQMRALRGSGEFVKTQKLAESIRLEVIKHGGWECIGELSYETIELLLACGLKVRTYSHRGALSTVVRKWS